MSKKIFSVFLVMLMLFSLCMPDVSAQEGTAVVENTDAANPRETLGELISDAVRILQSPEFGTYPADLREQFEMAFGEANGVYYNPDSTEGELTEQIENLQSVIDEINNPIVSEDAAYYLSSAIAEAELNVGPQINYTPASWTVYADALAKAKYVQTNGKTDTEVITAADELKSAVKSLVPVDSGISSARDYLREVINSAYYVLNGDENYTAESLRNLEDAIAAAESVYYDTSATAPELYLEADKIMNTISYMEEISVPEEIRNYLSEVIAMADSRVGDSEDYTPQSWSEYINAYNEALRVQLEGETENEFINAANALGVAVESLVPAATVARQALLAVINSAHQMLSSTDKFTAQSIEKLQSALDKANEVYVKETATEKELTEETSNLQSAMDSMERITISEDVRNYLSEVIAAADANVGAKEDYTAESWEVYNQAYLEAVRIQTSGVSEDEFIAAANALGAAMEGLVKADDELHKARAQLKTLIERGMPIGGNYTDSSWKALVDAMDKAQTVYDDENATVEEIKEQIKLLSDAINGLELVNISPEAKSTLWDAIDKSQADVADRADYTPESWRVYQDAYADAMATYHYGQSDEEYYAAAEKLLSAIESLVPAVTTPDEVVVILGDTDRNHKVNIKDATAIQKHLADIIELTGEELYAADTNADGKINVRDATEIQKHLAGLSANENIGKEVTVSVANKNI